MSKSKIYPEIVNLETELENMDNPIHLQNLVKEGHFMTIKELWDELIMPAIRPHIPVIIKWKNFLIEYVNKEDAVFAIRAFSTGPSPKNSEPIDRNLALNEGIEETKSNNPYTLRRGFYTKYSDKDFSFFYTDNFLAAYFLRMACDDYVPEQEDFHRKLQNRTFPARFNFSYTKAENAKAAFSIKGEQGVGLENPRLAPNPKFQSQGYKISHIVDTGMNYRHSNGVFGMSSILQKYFPRETYDKWTNNGKYYVRMKDYTEGAIDYLRAHFLRFACPMNYMLTPLANKSNFEFQQRGENAQIDYKDIGELTELQQYAMIQFHKLFGQDYDDYLQQIMFDRQLDKYFDWLEVNEKYLGDIIIDLYVKLPDSLKKKSMPKQTSKKKTESKVKPIQAKVLSSTSTKKSRRFSVNNALVGTMRDVVAKFVNDILLPKNYGAIKAADNDLKKLCGKENSTTRYISDKDSDFSKSGKSSKSSYRCVPYPSTDAPTFYITTQWYNNERNFATFKENVNKTYSNFQIS